MNKSQGEILTRGDFQTVPLFGVSCDREYPDVFPCVLISSNLFQFVFRTDQNNQGTPFLSTPSASARSMFMCWALAKERLKSL